MRPATWSTRSPRPRSKTANLECQSHYFRCRICVGGPWQKSDSNPVVITFRTSPINCVTDQDAENNWSLCVLSLGTADANTAARAALHVQSVLRRDYNLMRIDRTEQRRSNPNYLDVCPPVMRQ